MRVFAGPNGSGKTTIIKDLRSEIPFGTYIKSPKLVCNVSPSILSRFRLYLISTCKKAGRGKRRTCLRFF